MGQTQLTATLVADGFDGPVHVSVPPGETARLFVAEHRGRIKIVQDGTLLPTPFLDISSQVFSNGMMGMLSFAFHPNYASNGYFYVAYAADEFSVVLSRYSVSAGDPNVADAASETIIVGPVTTSGGLHQGGSLVFDDAGHIYFAIGSQREAAEVECGAVVCAALPCPNAGLDLPDYEYPHSVGCCVIGGVVYRGLQLPSQRGAYFFGDLCGNQAWSLRHTGGVVTEVTPLTIDVPPDTEIPLVKIVAFGLDGSGELLLVDFVSSVPGFGAIYRVGPTPTFQSIGPGLAGTTGVPQLEGTGTLDGGTALSIDISGARPGASATLVVGLGELSVNFQGGVLVPTPDILISGLVVDGSGEYSLAGSWPTGIPAGVHLYIQTWIQDSGAIKGFAATNGLFLTTP